MADPAAYGRDAPDVAWRPPADLLTESRIARLCAQTSLDLDALQARAVADPAWFWREALNELDLRWQRQPDGILDTSRGWAWTTWWSGGAFNHAEAALAAAARLPAEAPALIWEGEDGEVVTLTATELAMAVHVTARAFAAAGIGEGDARRDLPADVRRDRHRGPRAGPAARGIHADLLGLCGARRRGAAPGVRGDPPHHCGRLPAAREVDRAQGDGRCRGRRRADGPVGDRRPTTPRRGSPTVAMDAARDRWLDDLRAEAFAAPDIEVPPTDPETPYMVIYTSGTTGVPKGTVHVHGGFPIKAAQDLAHVFDLRAGDRLFWFTDLGWMMGPWTISGSLLLGATPVLYEGAPDTPGPDRLWQVASRHHVTHIGVSPTLVRALLVHGEDPVRGHDLSSLRVLGSTGEPWNPDPWWWYFRTVGAGRLPLVNYTGGTEVSGGILGNVVVRPIKPIGFNGPCPGIAADVVDPNDGTPVRGTVGELAIRGPWPGMTRGFWGGDTERYLDAYWRRIPDLWIHGDWAQIDGDGHWSLLGRSDDTLKVAGKRVGPAEVESAAVSHPAVVEAAAIGVPDELKGEVVVVLPVLRHGVETDAGLLAEIAGCVVRDLGPTLRPAAVVPVAELPRTRSGKIMRRVARAAFLGTDPGDTSALENPSAVDAIRAAAGARAGR